MSANKEEMEVDLRAAVEGEKAQINDDLNEIEVNWTEDEAQEAEAMGWIPPDRAGKLPDGKKFVGPKEFMERNPLYKEVKQLKSTLTQLNSHYQKVAETERTKAKEEYEAKLASLQDEKIKALDEEDHKRVVEIDNEIRNTNPPEEQVSDNTLFKDWVSKNDWYEADKFLKIEADMLGSQLVSKDLYGVDLFDTVKEHLKQKYPDRFKSPRDKPAAVEGSTNGNRASKKTYTINDLTQDERQIYNNFERMGVFKADGSAEKYIKEVIDLRD